VASISVQHDDRRGRHRSDRHRPADQHRDRGGRGSRCTVPGTCTVPRWYRFTLRNGVLVSL
jgi:hypothetical protein